MNWMQLYFMLKILVPLAIFGTLFLYCGYLFFGEFFENRRQKRINKKARELAKKKHKGDSDEA